MKCIVTINGITDTDFLKLSGVIFHGDKLAFKAYPYTDEYSDKDCDQLKDILTDDYSNINSMMLMKDVSFEYFILMTNDM